jgi:SWI/SNF-related matrix-associated actin-dependent regulator of chromatin subfamily A3
MPSASKRSHAGFVDLTGDTDDEAQQPQRKVARGSTVNSSSRGSWASRRPQNSRTEDDEEVEQNKIVDLTQTQDVDNHGTDFVPYGRIDGKIVGIRYYNGYATVGETVLVKREPRNQVEAAPSVLRAEILLTRCTV